MPTIRLAAILALSVFASTTGGSLAWAQLGSAGPRSKPASSAAMMTTTDLYGSTTPGGVVSGYGNYWFPSIYSYPTVGGSGYINYGFDGAAPVYFGVPGTPDSALSMTRNRVGALSTQATATTPASRGGLAAPKLGPKPTKLRRKSS